MKSRTKYKPARGNPSLATQRWLPSCYNDKNTPLQQYPNSNPPFHIVPKWATLMPLYFLQYHHHPNPLRHISIYNWKLYYFHHQLGTRTSLCPQYECMIHRWVIELEHTPERPPANVEGIHALYYLLPLVTCQSRQISPSFLLGSPSGHWSIWSEEESLLRTENSIACPSYFHCVFKCLNLPCMLF